ncbi:putative transmembrane transport protein [Streptomyces scabiei 87.22]|uniref:Putative transmembrane transport protein n=6 Tax=Streptomyces scabiei TaxID=1930 RepID=C9Z1H9_STRSW|nr:MMPL family transporter [Streptomyces scabiei]MDX2652772.1 MMPL family transporter [Streptomyces scabiei]MDX2722070.1 MMPL family transporter [Streptomyces scabiei]MDX2864418.1 MMPL family transporter [Streptomyces scabiei]MDX2883158.1 MMPL family transporter [Streptomyces scabiei]MDX2893511.1 MMPL family transporter [Streptomyces scabiei]
MPTIPRRARRLVPLLLIAVWLVVGGVLGPYAGRLGEVATNDQAAFLPRSAESTEVVTAQRAFRQDETLVAIVVWTGEGLAGRRTAADRALASLDGTPGVAGQVSPALLSEDREALRGVVPLRPDLGDALPGTLDRVRAAAERVPGTTVQLAGPAASQADLSDAFAGIDGLLLAVALLTVLVILLLVYRSVLLPLVIILGAVFALGLACAVVYALADQGVVRVDGQVQGILSILVIGAATDYALLLTARFREELGAHADRFAAMRAALRQSWGAIVASAATVALGLLALLLSDLTNNRALGPVGAIGIACAVLATLTFLPAVLVALGRAAYWPARPGGPSDAPGRGEGVWRRVAGLVDRAPRRVWALTLALLLAGAAFAPTLTSKGVPLDETFVNDAPSVAAQQTLGDHFPGGSGNPAVVVADADRLERVLAAARDTDGVATAAAVDRTGRPGGEPLVVDGRVRVDVTLDAAADSDAAKRTVARLRTALHAVPGADALVGGYTAQQYDTLRTAERDRTLIVPVVLVLILLILTGLLRSLLLPVLLVATVALNFLATLGVSALVFRHVLGFTGTDPSVPLYGFVFLVALGVDYNIFLMSRVREESLRHGAREGVLRGLVSTGGVITSAGVVLAATFAALGVIPLAFLAQIAFIVAFGVLLDTLVVRSLLVPALVRDLGERAWWPGSVRSDEDGTGA